MRSYYDAGIPSPSAAFDRSFQVMFERVIKTKEFEETAKTISRITELGEFDCRIRFNDVELSGKSINELVMVLRYLGYNVYVIKLNKNDYPEEIEIDWYQDYGKRI